MNSSFTSKQQAVAMDSKRNVYLLTPMSKAILQGLSDKKEKTYVQLAKQVNASYPSICVYVGRLVTCGLISKREADNRVYVKARVNLNFNIEPIKV